MFLPELNLISIYGFRDAWFQGVMVHRAFPCLFEGSHRITQCICCANWCGARGSCSIDKQNKSTHLRMIWRCVEAQTEVRRGSQAQSSAGKLVTSQRSRVSEPQGGSYSRRREAHSGFSEGRPALQCAERS